MSKDRPKDRSRKIRKRRTTATVGGTTQSGFANRSMSDMLKQQRPDGDPERDGKRKKKPEAGGTGDAKGSTD